MSTLISRKASRKLTEMTQRSPRSSYSGRNTSALSPSEARRNLRRGFNAPSGNRDTNTSLDVGAAASTLRPQPSIEQTRQNTQPLRSSASPTLETLDHTWDDALEETLDEKPKNSEDFNNARQRLEHELHRIGLIDLQNPHFHHDTSDAKINDIIIFPHTDFCKNEDHSWLPAPGGYLQTKYSWAVVLEDYAECLKLGLSTTFSNTPMEDVRKKTVFDEVEKKRVLVLSSYVHMVAADHQGKSDHYPECFMGGVPVGYRSAPGCPPGLAKDSFMNPHTPYFMADGTPFLIMGDLESAESTEILNMAVKATGVRTLKARANAMEARLEERRIEKEAKEA